MKMLKRRGNVSYTVPETEEIPKGLISCEAVGLWVGCGLAGLAVTAALQLFWAIARITASTVSQSPRARCVGLAIAPSCSAAISKLCAWSGRNIR